MSVSVIVAGLAPLDREENWACRHRFPSLKSFANPITPWTLGFASAQGVDVVSLSHAHYVYCFWTPQLDLPAVAGVRPLLLRGLRQVIQQVAEVLVRRQIAQLPVQ